MQGDRDRTSEPTSSAEMTVTLGPAASWNAVIRGEQTFHLLTTAGVVMTTSAGIAGAVFTMRLSFSLTNVALAELSLALVTSVLIIGYGLHRARQVRRAQLNDLANQIELARRAQEELRLRAATRGRWTPLHR